ncbi:DUF1893 domain-containing protein [uncultured Alistipes sp.]|uniref:DUF1893 domain-containing protein n=1 Tax=uncultured Alistipes sp. TaxID=538949 RepID=UPI00260A4781|nr:DUF1893 domain-containing protein [uncultured Alistipes sp.]
MNTTVTPRELTAEERQFLIDTLFRERCSCVIRSGDVIRIFRERGVKDLFRLLKEEPAMLRGAFIADKVVGKAAAALMVLGGVRELFADVISHSALELLARYRVRVSYTVAVDHIINRTRTGWCPMEIRCRECTTADECLEQIEDFMKTLPS